jgi:hypothetical protein
MAMEEMKQRTGEEQQIGEDPERVAPMLSQ